MCKQRDQHLETGWRTATNIIYERCEGNDTAAVCITISVMKVLIVPTNNAGQLSRTLTANFPQISRNQ